MINVTDFMGIKKSDSIDNFYKIETVIGRGKSQNIYSFLTRNQQQQKTENHMNFNLFFTIGAFGEVVRA